MSDNALNVLKFCLMALLYLFLARVVWVVAREMRGTPQPVAAPLPTGGEATPAEGRGSKAKATKGGGWQLVVLSPLAAAGQTYPVAGELTVGRAAGCAIRLDDDTFVSSLHARIYERDGAVWLEDLGSTNGTTVNGGRVSAPQRLRKRDKVVVGDTVLEVRR